MWTDQYWCIVWFRWLRVSMIKGSGSLVQFLYYENCADHWGLESKSAELAGLVYTGESRQEIVAIQVAVRVGSWATGYQETLWFDYDRMDEDEQTRWTRNLFICNCKWIGSCFGRPHCRSIVEMLFWPHFINRAGEHLWCTSINWANDRQPSQLVAGDGNSAMQSRSRKGRFAMGQSPVTWPTSWLTAVYFSSPSPDTIPSDPMMKQIIAITDAIRKCEGFGPVMVPGLQGNEIAVKLTDQKPPSISMLQQCEPWCRPPTIEVF